MNDSDKLCPACGVKLLLFFHQYSQTQLQELWRCVRCRYEEVGALKEGYIESDSDFRIVIRWGAERLSIESMKLLRNVDPRLGALPAGECFKKLRAAQCWEIGELSYTSVRDVKARLEHVGFHCEIKSI